MGKLIFTAFFVFCMFTQCLAARPVIQSKDAYSVVSYGAKGDGKTDDTQAFLKAWEDACGASSPLVTLSVPQGLSYLLQPLVFEGPCKAKSIHFELLGGIVAPNRNEWKGDNTEAWIRFLNIQGLVIDGKDTGTIDGKGPSWWEKSQNDDDSRPTALHIHGCDDLSILQTKHVDSQKNHISINGCNRVKIANLHIIAPDESPNTDGIDISKSSYVQVKDSVIETGDDCIAMNNATFNVEITGIMCGPGHGISVGSLGKNGDYNVVEHVYVSNCTFKATQNGARIKTWEGGSGYVSNITFEGIRFEDAKHPIIIDQKYTNRATLQDSVIYISNVSFKNMQGTSASKEAITLNCSGEKGCTNITMNHINIVGSKGAVFSTCHNAHGTPSDVTPDVSSCLT